MLEVYLDEPYDLVFNKVADVNDVLDSLEARIDDIDAEDFPHETEIIDMLVKRGWLQLANGFLH